MISKAWCSLVLQSLEGVRGAAPGASRTGRRARLRARLATKAPRRRAAAQYRPCHVHVRGAERRAAARATRGGPRRARRSRWAGPAAARSWLVPTASQAATDQSLSLSFARISLCQCGVVSRMAGGRLHAVLLVVRRLLWPGYSEYRRTRRSYRARVIRAEVWGQLRCELLPELCPRAGFAP